MESLEVHKEGQKSFPILDPVLRDPDNVLGTSLEIKENKWAWRKGI